MKAEQAISNLWHYTTFEGARNILSSQMLWATDYRSLNDSSEVNYSKEILLEAVIPFVTEIVTREYTKNSNSHEIIRKLGGIDTISRSEALDTIEVLYKSLLESPTLKNTPHVLSFCQVPKNNNRLQRQGLLSQWRGYGPDGGIALIFELDSLIEQFKVESSSFYYGICGDGAVSYGTINPKDIILSPALKIIVKYASEVYHARISGKSIPQASSQILSSLVHCMMLLKHDGFSEELEYRFFSIPCMSDALNHKSFQLEKNGSRSFKTIKTRVKNGAKINYIECFEKTAKLPIIRIVVGPHKSKESRAQEFNKQLKSLGLNDIPVDISNIPFIGN